MTESAGPWPFGATAFCKEPERFASVTKGQARQIGATRRISFGNLDLASLATIYNLEFREAHHALDDAFVTARLCQELMYRLESRGVRTLAELLKIGTP
jgi:DNA polymerase III epsilon subunit-like protein